MQTALIYVRVSSEDQAVRGYSLSAQEEDCRRRAAQLGYSDEQVVIFRDEGFSGDDLERPGLVRLREAVRARAGEVVIIYDPDRFARNLTHQLIITDEIVGVGLRLEFVNFEWKDTAEGRLFYSLRGAIAEYEKAKIKERSIRGRLQKAKSGKLNGDPRVYGYTFDPESDTLHLNPDEARVIKLMYQWYLEGREGKRMSCQGIARALALEGIPAPRNGTRWYSASVRRILMNETYLGTYWAYKCDYHTGKRRSRERDKQFPVPVEPIIDEQSYRRVQETIATNREKHRGRSTNNYLLKSLIQCGECGRALCGSVSAGSRLYRYYTCQGRVRTNRGFDVGTGTEQKKCHNRFWPVPMLDDAVWNMLADMIRNPEAFLADLRRDQSNQDSLAELQQELEVVRAGIEELKAQRTRLVRLFTSGRIDERSFDAEVRPIDARTSQAEARLRDLQAAVRQREDTERLRETAAETIRRYQKNLDNLTFEGKRWLVEQFVRRVDVYADGRVRVTGTLGDLQQHMGVYANQSYAQSDGGPPA